METKKTFFEKEAFQITILIFMPIFSFLYFMDSFIFPKATHYSDYTISHFPNLVYLQNSLQSGFGLPLWNSQILSGFPSLANPLSGIWYPGNWFSVSFHLPLGSHLITVLHLIIGGIGMYLFLRKQEFSTYASLFGAIAFQLMPKLFAHYAAGHISLVQAITYTPWVLYLQQVKNLNSNKKWLYFVTGILYALVILCDIRWVAYLLIIDLIFFINEYITGQAKSSVVFAKQFVLRMVPVILGVLFTSFYIFPFVEYVNMTDRSLMTASDILNFSLPIGNLMGIVIPDMGGYAEYVVYPGIVIWITFLGSFTIKSLRKKFVGLLIFMGLLMLYSIGGNLPFMNWVAHIPGINLLRVPSRMYFLVAVLMVYVSSAYLSRIQFTDEPRKTINLLPQFFTLLFSAAIMGIVIYSGDVLISDFYWPVIMSVMVFLLFIFRKNTNRFRGLFQALLLIFCIIDLTIVNTSQYDIYSEQRVLESENEIIELIKPTENEYYRVYSPSYSVEQQISAANDISLVNGIDPLHLATYADFMEKATGVSQNGYSVTIPTFKNGNIKEDNKEAIPDPELLGLLNVRYVVSAFPITNIYLNEIKHIDGTYIYENSEVLHRAWVEDNGESFFSKVENIIIEPNKIIIDANGPGKLVLSEIDYPGWKATNNGQKMKIEPVYGILRSITLSRGKNHIEMIFKPDSLITGSIVSIISLISTIIFLFFYKESSQT